MSAWHKALQNVHRAVLAEVIIYCTGTVTEYPWSGDPGVYPTGKCGRLHEEEDSLERPTKLDGIRNAKAQGWTWDRSGDWLCPECSEGAE